MILLVIKVFPQALPNNSFENWTDYLLYSEPDDWHTPNTFTFIAGIETVKESTDAFDGSMSAELESFDFAGITIPGILTLAEINIDFVDSTYGISGGFFLQENVFKLTGRYKYQGIENDSATVFMYNFKNTAETGYDTIGFGVNVMGNATEWTPFSVYMYNLNNQVPDTFNVVISSSMAIGAQVGSKLWVDSLSIYTNTGIIDLWGPKPNLKAYPNPASNYITFETEEIINDSYISIYSPEGRLVFQQNFDGFSAMADISSLPKGIYAYKLMVKNRIKNSGSFIKN